MKVIDSSKGLTVEMMNGKILRFEFSFKYSNNLRKEKI